MTWLDNILISDNGESPVDGFEGIENTSKFQRKEMLKTVRRGIFLTLALKILKNYKKFAKVRIGKLKKLANNLHDKTKSFKTLKILNHALILIKKVCGVNLNY